MMRTVKDITDEEYKRLADAMSEDFVEAKSISQLLKSWDIKALIEPVLRNLNKRGYMVAEETNPHFPGRFVYKVVKPEDYKC